jgi:hypothetical protein
LKAFTTFDFGDAAGAQRRGGLVVELRDLAVALWIVVVGIDDDLACERLDRYPSCSSSTAR